MELAPSPKPGRFRRRVSALRSVRTLAAKRSNSSGANSVVLIDSPTATSSPALTYLDSSGRCAGHQSSSGCQHPSAAQPLRSLIGWRVLDVDVRIAGHAVSAAGFGGVEGLVCEHQKSVQIVATLRAEAGYAGADAQGDVAPFK